MMNFPTGGTNAVGNRTPQAAWLTLTIIWGALLMGQIAFMCVLAIILSQPPQRGARGLPPDPQSIQILVIVNTIMLVTIIPTVGLVRQRMLNRSRVDGLVPAQTYASASIIFWAGCEGVSFFALVIALLSRSFWPTGIIVAIAMGIQVVTYPRKAAMVPPAEPGR